MAGRKPKYGKAMTSAEKAREYRERKKAQGEKLVYFALDDKVVKAIDEIVEFYELDGRAEAVWGLLKYPLNKAYQDTKGYKTQLGSLDNESEADLEAIRLAKKLFWEGMTDHK